MPPELAQKQESPDLTELENFSNFLRYERTPIFNQFIRLRFNTIALFTGNQFGKTGACAYQYVLRILGTHPVPEKNVLYFECPNKHLFNKITLPKDWICPQCKSEIKIHQRGNRIFRFASEVLPGEKSNVSEDGQSAEVKNSIYPEFKKWLPPFLIKRDITFRNMAMIIHDPNIEYEFCGERYKGEDIVVEFVAYSQTVASTAGKQRMSVWEDEEAPYDFHEEQLPRLIAENGDLLISLTPANKLSWTYDEIFERARVYLRTQTICDYLTTRDHKVETIEWTDNKTPIAVIQAATDDNPTLNLEAIEEKMSLYDDPDIVATRRYGVHKQVKGRIFKGFDYPTHFIEKNEYFPEGIPTDWTHARGIDYHPQTNWACGCISLSPTNEAFIWKEYNPSPEMFTTAEICRDFAVMTAGYKFILNLIDPLSEEIKKDKITIRDDINREFWELKKDGIGLNSYWQCWDTKGEKGRDEIRKRLKNSKEVGRPFNNKKMKDGRETYLPTIWILNTCPLTAKSIKMWRWEEYTDTKMAMVKGDKNKPQQRWSHFNTTWEALFKHPAFKPRKNIPREERGASYFQGRR